MKGKIIWPLALLASAALFYNTQTASADSLNLKLFPRSFDRTVLPDSDIASTRLKMPTQNLENQLSNETIGELSGNLNLGAQLPLVSIGIVNKGENAKMKIIENPDPGIKNVISNETLKATRLLASLRRF